MKIPALADRWRAAIGKILLIYLLAAGLGLLTGHLAGFIALASSALLGWHLWNAYRLDHWARSPLRRAPPESFGVWAVVFDGLYRNRRQQLKRRRTLARIIREVRQLTDALPDGVVLLDTENRIRWFNGSAADLLGLRRNQDGGRPLTNLLRSPMMRDWLKTKTSDNAGITVASPADPKLIVRLRILDYGQTRRVLLARDVTEVARAETMRKDFVANASHELRTPLTVISGYLESMEEEGEDPWRSAITQMRQQARRMQSIIEDLLILSRLESRSVLKREAEVRMADFLHGLHAEAQLLSAGRQRIGLTIGTQVNVLAEPTDLRSALMNLITNAVSYTPAGGNIDISWREGEDGWLEFAVRDDGPGIAARHLPRLTERFYRISGDRSRASGGTGLGLAIVKHVMALHDGELAITSELGAGSEFCCRFPPGRGVRELSAVG